MKDTSFCRACRRHVLSTEGKVEVVRYVVNGQRRTMTRFVCPSCQVKKKERR